MAAAEPIVPAEEPQAGPDDALDNVDPNEDPFDLNKAAEEFMAEMEPSDIPEADDEFRIDLDDGELLQILRDYLNVGKTARETGLSARDAQWDANWDGYWARYEAKDKADWQAQEVLPEVQNLVDRFAASMRGALFSRPDFYSIEDPLKRDSLVMQHLKNFTDLILDSSSSNVTGQPTGFQTTFGNIAKSGALMAMCGSCTWDPIERKVRIEAVDPREIYFDPTGRGLFRVRQWEDDWHVLDEMAAIEDSEGEALYDLDAIAALQAGHDEEGRDDKARSTGTDHVDETTGRKPILFHEYLCDIINNQGELVAKNQLIVVANERVIIRGPEPNPYWHKRDWIVFAPAIGVPFSVYGRTFVEGFRQLVNTFIEMTNLILDASFTDSLNMFMIWPDALEDPDEAAEWHPGKMFLADENWPPGQDFMKPVQSGRLGNNSMAVWQAMQAMVRDAASQNEMSLGQLPPKGDITAFEIGTVEQNRSELVRAIAADAESLVVGPLVELAWMTGLQHFDPKKDKSLARQLGPDVTDMLVSQRETFRHRRFRFRVYGITGAIRRSEKLQSLLGMLQIVAQNEQMMGAFLKRFSVDRLLEQVMELFGIDIPAIEKTEDEKQRDAQLAAAQAQAQAAPGGAGGRPAPGGAAPPVPAPPGAQRPR